MQIKTDKFVGKINDWIGNRFRGDINNYQGKGCHIYNTDKKLGGRLAKIRVRKRQGPTRGRKKIR